MPNLNLQKREKIMVMAAAAVAAIVLGIFLAGGPVEDYRRAKNQVKQARLNFNSAKIISEELLRDRRQREDLQKLLQGGQVDLWSHIGKVLNAAGLMERGAKIQSRQRVARSSNLSGIQVTLKGVSTEELVDFLHNVYGGGLVVLHQLRYLKPAPNGKGLDCDMTFIAAKL